MHLQLINYFEVILTLSLLVFFDIIIKFKHPLILKMMLLLITFSIGGNAFASVYCPYNGYNRWIAEMPLILLFVGCINLLSILYSHKIKKKILIFTSSILLLQVFFLFYFSYIHPIDSHIKLKDIEVMGLFRKIIRIIASIATLVIVVDLYFKIFKKYATENLYFKQVIQWSSLLIVTFSICMVINILNTINARLETLLIIIKGIAHLITLLFILYRPSFLNNTRIKITLNDTFNFKSINNLKSTEFAGHFFYPLYYLKNEANINTLSDNLGTNVILLQEYIKEQYGMTFIELVNKCRIDYFVSLVKSGSYKNFTIDALSGMSGFNSRQNLQRAFKTFHGGTPSDLIKAGI